jgi:hypothetical protein
MEAPTDEVLNKYIDGNYRYNHAKIDSEVPRTE